METVPTARDLMLRFAERTKIECFWLEPAHRETTTWQSHADINEVMLATSLRPEGLLGHAA